eukprot:8932913-Alexandrium_andersonii.AAC.1
MGPWQETLHCDWSTHTQARLLNSGPPTTVHGNHAKPVQGKRAHAARGRPDTRRHNLYLSGE